MKLKENFNNLMEKSKKLTKEQLNTYRIISFVAIVVEIIGIYYFLHLEKVGMILMVITLAFLGFILYLQSKLPKEADKQESINPDDRFPPGAIKNQKKKKEVRKMEGMNGEEEREESEFDFGLPSSDEYNKRVMDAFEFKGI